MSEQNDNKDLAEITEPPVLPSKEEKTDAPKKARTGALWFFTLLNLLFVLLIVAGAYWAYLQWQEMQNNKSDKTDVYISQIQQLQSQVDSVRQASSNSEQSIQNSVNNLVEELLESKQQISALESKLADVSGRRPADWLLAEADYLVRMAGRKLWLENDVRTAMMMLKSADNRLEDLADPSLFPVRKLIAEDIQTLHQVNPVSNSSIALALSGMIPQVEKLDIAALQIPEPTNAQASSELSEDVSDWRANLSKTWQAIRDDFISISRTEQAIEPYLSDKQQWLVKEQLKYALTQAQSAVLADNETLFKASIQQALALVIEYYDLSSNSVEQFSAALQQLSSTSIEKNYPSKLNSQAALSDIIENRIENVFTNKQTGEL